MPKNKLKLIVGYLGNVYADRFCKNGIMSSKREDVTETFKEALLIYVNNGGKCERRIDYKGKNFNVYMEEVTTNE